MRWREIGNYDCSHSLQCLITHCMVTPLALCSRNVPPETVMPKNDTFVSFHIHKTQSVIEKRKIIFFSSCFTVI